MGIDTSTLLQMDFVASGADHVEQIRFESDHDAWLQGAEPRFDVRVARVLEWDPEGSADWRLQKSWASRRLLGESQFAEWPFVR